MRTIDDYKTAVLLKTAKIWPDKFYLENLYRLVTNGESINLDNPQSLNDKINWLKLYDRNPLYTKLADKYEVKKYVKDKIGEEYVVPNYGVYNSFEEIDFDSLPDSFIIKTTHDSGGGVICRSKSSFDLQQAQKKLNKLLKQNYYPKYREWVYKNIPPRLIVDHLLDDHSGHELQDYKFWCFNGEPKVIYLTNKGKDIFENFYDMDFKELDINHGFERVKPEFNKPLEFGLMKELATKLAEGIPFVRVDFFDVNGKVYFGEYTFYDWGGMQPFQSKEWEMKMGSWIKLPLHREK